MHNKKISRLKRWRNIVYATTSIIFILAFMPNLNLNMGFVLIMIAIISGAGGAAINMSLQEELVKKGSELVDDMGNRFVIATSREEFFNLLGASYEYDRVTSHWGEPSFEKFVLKHREGIPMIRVFDRAKIYVMTFFSIEDSVCLSPLASDKEIENWLALRKIRISENPQRFARAKDRIFPIDKLISTQVEFLGEIEVAKIKEYVQ